MPDNSVNYTGNIATVITSGHSMDTLFADEYVQSLPQDPVTAGIQICETFRKWADEQFANGITEEIANACVDAFGFLAVYGEMNGFTFTNPELTQDPRDVATRINSAFVQCLEALRLDATKIRLGGARERYANLLGQRHHYEFSDGDLDEIQTKLNDLRATVVNASGFSDDHRKRLLDRVEAVQRELHKRMSSLDTFWGLMMDGVIAEAAMADAAKPIFDRIKDIVEIAWRSMTRAEELPSGTPFPKLGDNDRSD